MQYVPFDFSNGRKKTFRFFKRHSYKLPASVECVVSVVTTMVSVLDSGMGPSLIRLWQLAENWHSAVHLVDSPPLKNASNRPPRPPGSLALFVQTSRFQARI